MFRLRSNPNQIFETIDAALEFAEVQDSNCTVLDDVGDILVRRWRGGRLEYPVGTFSAAESAQLALVRRSR